jgi:cell division septal protein FtsQ
MGCRFIGRLLFASNNRYTIEHLDIQAGSIITADLVSEYTQIKKGMNLFAFDISKVRKDLTRQSPNIKSVEISRQLPDTLKMRIVERVPLARVGRKSSFVVDEEGYVFNLRAGYRELPVITGYRDPNMKPGSRLCGIALAALEALEACYDPKLGLHVDEVEVNNSEYVVLYIPDGDKTKEVDLAWKGMGKRTNESRQCLTVKLCDVARALQSEEGRQRSKFNATLDGRLFAGGG